MTPSTLANLALEAPLLPSPNTPPTPVYPTSDGEPVAETFAHLYAILMTVAVLKQYLQGQEATVLANQFVYYMDGNPRARFAPDVMVAFGVKPGGRDHYKIWEEGQVPRVIFEMTSASTQGVDEVFKKTLYAHLGVEEYWLFDPRQEWQPQSLQGFRLVGESYQPINNLKSQALGLRLVAKNQLIHFYRLDTGEKLLTPDEMALVLGQTQEQLGAAQEQLDEAQEQLGAAQEQLGQTQEQLDEAQEQLGQTQEQLTAEQQRAAELETLLAQYRDRFGAL